MFAGADRIRESIEKTVLGAVLSGNADSSIERFKVMNGDIGLVSNDFANARCRLVWEFLERRDQDNAYPHDRQQLAIDLAEQTPSMTHDDIIDLIADCINEANKIPLDQYESYGRRLRFINEKQEMSNTLAQAKAMVDHATYETGGETMMDAVNSVNELMTKNDKSTSGGLSALDMGNTNEQFKLMFDGSYVSKALRVGMDAVDDVTGGFEPGQLIYLAARTGVGKTSLAINWAVRIAQGSRDGTQKPKTVVIFELEMMEDELNERIIGGLGRINIDNFKKLMGKRQRGEFKDKHVADQVEDLLANEYEVFKAASDVAASLPIARDCTPGVNTSQIMTRIRTWERKVKDLGWPEIGLVVIDYVQIMGATKNQRSESTVAQIEEISKKLKEMAKELGYPFLVLAQLNRTAATGESDDDDGPQITQLRGSGSLEQDADKIIMLYQRSRPGAFSDYGDVQQEGEARQKWLHDVHSGICRIAKNRQGGIRDVPMIIDSARQTYITQYDAAEELPFGEFIRIYGDQVNNDYMAGWHGPKERFWPTFKSHLPQGLQKFGGEPENATASYGITKTQLEYQLAAPDPTPEQEMAIDDDLTVPFDSDDAYEDDDGMEMLDNMLDMLSDSKKSNDIGNAGTDGGDVEDIDITTDIDGYDDESSWDS